MGWVTGYSGRVRSWVNSFLLRVKKIGFGSGIFGSGRVGLENSDSYCHVQMEQIDGDLIENYKPINLSKRMNYKSTIKRIQKRSRLKDVLNSSMRRQGVVMQCLDDIQIGSTALSLQQVLRLSVSLVHQLVQCKQNPLISYGFLLLLLIKLSPLLQMEEGVWRSHSLVLWLGSSANFQGIR